MLVYCVTKHVQKVYKVQSEIITNLSAVHRSTEISSTLMHLTHPGTESQHSIATDILHKYRISPRTSSLTAVSNAATMAHQLIPRTASHRCAICCMLLLLNARELYLLNVPYLSANTITTPNNLSLSVKCERQRSLLIQLGTALHCALLNTQARLCMCSTTNGV